MLLPVQMLVCWFSLGGSLSTKRWICTMKRPRRPRSCSSLYANILPLAQAMELNERHLMASFLYRVVLDELLQQGYSKSYHHGVGYLRKLDAMSEKIADWKELVPHADYVSQLRKTHSLKGSFWSQYGGILG